MGAIDMVTLFSVYVENVFPKYNHFETEYA